jgi:XTP/dITP diphosphohydrolase
MLQLLYGTGNPAKLGAMRDWLSDLPILLGGLDEHAPAVPEDGITPLENARQKALCYYRTYLRPVFSCDSGLVLSGVPEAKNPGVHARRPGGKPLSDEEMLAYYAGLALEFGRDGFLPARYQNAICLVTDGGTFMEYDGEDICSDTFLLAAKPHPMRTPGWPLDSLSVSLQTGKYWFDMSQEERLLSHRDLRPGFVKFFRQAFNL